MALASRRERLLNAAPRLFARQGYAATSLQELADAAGCSKSALYHHFASKDELLEASGEGFITDVEAALSSVSLDLDEEQDKVAVMETYLVALGAHREVAKVLLIDVGARSTAIGQRVVEQQRSLVARLSGRRAPLRQQVRAHCAVTISHLMVGELSSVPVHRLRPPLLEAITQMLARTDLPGSLGSAAPNPSLPSPSGGP